MSRSPRVRATLIEAVVWPIYLVLAVALLLVPVHWLLVPHWPGGIEERRSGDEILLVAAGLDDAPGRLRSQPLSAARVDLGERLSELGFVVGLREDPATAVRPPPDLPFWHPPAPCELGIADPSGEVRWLDCDAIARVVQPNRLAWLERLAVAVDRLAGTVGPAVSPAVEGPWLPGPGTGESGSE
ncbi:MAG: hypothetical protein R3323_00340 [Wenzhouxiangellaceae bacterium]|nr:hypothetical protein [Wenzhouxiangellaceae bacterium]